MTNPVVSIITPSYNQGSYLSETIESVLSQNYPNIEYIIVDGGSTDDSLNIIKEYQQYLKFWISEPDHGQADAINKGLMKSSGDYICWINSDDILYQDFVSKRMEQFLMHPEADFIYGDVDQGEDKANIRVRRGQQTNFHKMLKSLHVPIPQQSAIWKREIFEKVGLLDTKWDVLLDREYFLRIAQKFNIRYIPGTLAFFRNHLNSKSIASEGKWAIEIPQLYEEIFYSNNYGLSPEVYRRKKYYLIRSYIIAEKIARKCANDNLSIDLRNKSLKCSKPIYYYLKINNFFVKQINRFRNLYQKYK